MRINTKLAHISIILLFLLFFFCLSAENLSPRRHSQTPSRLQSDSDFHSEAKPKDALFKSPQLVFSLQAKTLKVLAALKDDEQ